MNYCMQGFLQKLLKRLVPILLLTVVIFLASNLLLVATAEQNPTVVNSPNEKVELSSRVAKVVIAEISNQTGIPAEKLKITQYSRQTWSNGCLGISKPKEICTQALVEGWRVVVSGNRRTWVYRSDRNGRILRLEPTKK